MKIFRIFCISLMILTISLSMGLAKNKPEVRMAYLQNDIHHLALWVAMEKGFFEEENVKIDVVGAFKAGPEIMSAYSAGALDMAYVGEAPATTAVANKATDAVVVAQVNTEGSALVIKRDEAEIEAIQDLIGKTVAVPGHSTVQDFLLRKGLTKAGVEPQKVNIIVLKPPEMITSLQSEQIHAFIAWEPYPSQAITRGVGQNLATSQTMWPEHPCCVLTAAQNFLQDYPNVVKGVIQAHLKGTAYINQHPKEAAAIGVEYTGMKKSTVRRAMKAVNYTPNLSIIGEKEYVNFLSEFGYINIKDTESFIQDFINPSLLNSVIE